MSVVEELQTAVSSIAERVGPSIVGIGRGTRGSGVVIGAGKVLTNAHNLRGDEVTVTFADGRRTRGTVAGFDGDGDLAVIDVDTAGAAALEWGDGAGLSVGRPSSEPAPATTAAPASRSASSRRSPASSAVRAGGGSTAASSTRRRSRRGRPAARSSDADGQLVGLNTNRIGEGLPRTPRRRRPPRPGRRARPRRVAEAGPPGRGGRPVARRAADAPLGRAAGA